MDAKDEGKLLYLVWDKHKVDKHKRTVQFSTDLSFSNRFWVIRVSVKLFEIAYGVGVYLRL